MAQAEAPVRTLTFLFTDIEGSTRLWERYPQAMPRSLARHDAVLRARVEAAGGQVVKTTGDGLMAVFGSSRDGVRASVEAQLDLSAEEWGETGPLRVRMGLHTGEVAVAGSDYHGPTVNRTARLMAAGHGGQILLSYAAASLVRDDLPEPWSLLDLGEHRLKDLARPEHVFQLAHPSLVGSFPPLVTLDTQARGLPSEGSAFVGREDERRALEDLLQREPVRLVTLTGPGGIGKTRLALRAAANLQASYAHGASFVDLSDARETAAVLLAIARQVGLTDSSEKAQMEELAAHLREQQMLLVLDNFEQVTQASTAAARLIAECPRLKLMVTSREPLHVRGEHLFPVPPMGLPDATARTPSAERLERFEAIALFVERARAVRPDFRLTDDNAAAVVEICRRLDGLPLAIELATARIGTFTPEALRDRLAGSAGLLRGGARDLPERQQTLRATIAWSHQLLESDEQRLFALLAVFHGSSMEDVEAVAGRVSGWPTDFDAIDGLESLVDKSLVRQFDAAAGASRFAMLETIRAFATDQLDADPDLATTARRAHAEHFCDFAARQSVALAGDRRETALEQMVPERENLRTAWRHWVAGRDRERLETFIDALWQLYQAKGWYRSTIEVAADMIGVIEDMPRTTERSIAEVTLRASKARALMVMEGYTDAVETEYARALALIESSPEVPETFPVLTALASYYTYRAEFERSADLGRRMLRMAASEGDHSQAVHGHLALGSSLVFLGDIEGGIHELELGIETFESHPFRSGKYRVGNDPRVTTLTTASLSLWLAGRIDASLARSERALSMAETLGHPSSLAHAQFHRGFLSLWRDEPEAMHMHAQAAIDIADEADLPIWRAVGVCLLGAATASLGDADDGLAMIRTGIATYRGLRTPPVFWPLLLYTHAWACARVERHAEGLTLVDEALALAGADPRMAILPELCLLRGDLLVAGGGGSSAAPVWERAFGLAASTGAKMSQLRAATRLARLATDPQEPATWLRTTSDLYATFTEGLATSDLVAARELLG